GGSVGLTWTAIPGRFYRVDSKVNDLGSQWQALPGEIQATAETAEKTGIARSGKSAFYRVVQLE
ncbi:MAG TPA: hypothetical protein VGR78_04035, partial [Verrucomicrobiae bacterium]|nr:hypothetical protein [Verrucomicrobiae bacterium]